MNKMMRKFVCAIMIMAMAGLSVSCNNKEVATEQTEPEVQVVEEVAVEEVEVVEAMEDTTEEI